MFRMKPHEADLALVRVLRNGFWDQHILKHLDLEIHTVHQKYDIFDMICNDVVLLLDHQDNIV